MIHSTEKKPTFQRHCYHDCLVTVRRLIHQRSYLHENSKGSDIEKKCYWWDRELKREKKYGFLPYIVSQSSFSIYSLPLHLIPTWLALSPLIFCLPDIHLMVFLQSSSYESIQSDF